jgi:pimeloyl-ACP methyl ester carboxylesterase
MITVFSSRITRLKILAGGIAAAAVAAASFAGLQGTAVARAADAAATRPLNPKPTIVLVHGAWADSSGWSGVISRLDHDGYTVLADPNPLRGLASDAAYLSAFIKARTTGPVILVGHSYGGAVITDAALHDPTVKALVYIDAFAPAKGQSCLSLIASVPGPNPSTLFTEVKYPGAPAGDADLYLKTPVFVNDFADGVPKGTAAIMAAEQRPVTLSALTQPGATPAFSKLPSWYVLGTEDKIIPPALELKMAKQAHARITRVAAGHLSMVTKPGVVTNVILAAVSYYRHR